MQYSHYSALPFMRIHAEFIKKNDMHQDVLMVGKSKKNKMEALISIKDALIADDFNRITFLKIEEKENKEEVIHDDGVDNGKSYRVIYVSVMSHQSMMACTALSGLLYGATGDQSLGEGISANKLLVYECLPHKQALMDDYYQAMRKILSSEQDACAVLDFLQDLNEHSNMNTLGDKLRNKAIQAKIQGANQTLLVQSDLISAVFSKINQWELELCQYVAALLSAGEQQLAIDILCKFSEYIPSTGTYNDKPFLNYATENDPKGPFVQWYHQKKIACYLRNKNEQGALDYLLQHDIKHPTGLFLEQANDYRSSGVFLAYVGLIDAGKTDDALILALKDHISIAAPWDDKTIWQYTIEDKSRISFCLNVLKFYNLSNQLDAFFKDVAPWSFLTFPGKELFFWALDNDKHEVVAYIIKSVESNSQHQEMLVDVLQTKNDGAETYLMQLRRTQPHAHTTHLASMWYIVNQINTYQAQPNSQRQQMHQAFLLDAAAISFPLDAYCEKALIGLLLRDIKQLAAGYSGFFSPRKGLYFGSQLYALYEDVLRYLGVDMSKLTRDDHRLYQHELTQRLNDKLQNPNGFYVLVKYLGQGRWGKAYQAQYCTLVAGQPTFTNTYAIKKINGLIRDNYSLREFNLFKQANPGKYCELLEKGDKTYLVMPLLPGVSLDQYLKMNPGLSFEDRQKMGVALLSVVSVLHQNGVIHCDLKSNNVLYDAEKVAMHIVDFGSAEAQGANMRYQGILTAKCALEYMPPEYVDGITTSAENDIYSMALILAEIFNLDKQTLVQGRINRALASMEDEALITTISQRFQESKNLDRVMLSYGLSSTLDRRQVLDEFIKNHVNDKYDFKPFTSIIGEDIVKLLEAMQVKNPKDRPSIEDCLAQLGDQAQTNSLKSKN